VAPDLSVPEIRTRPVSKAPTMRRCLSVVRQHAEVLVGARPVSGRRHMAHDQIKHTRPSSLRGPPASASASQSGQRNTYAGNQSVSSLHQSAANRSKAFVQRASEPQRRALSTCSAPRKKKNMDAPGKGAKRQRFGGHNFRSAASGLSAASTSKTTPSTMDKMRSHLATRKSA